MNTRQRILIILLFVLVHRDAVAQVRLSAAVSGQIDRLFAAFHAETPGCAIGVFRDGHVAYAKGYGSATVEHDAPITPATPFNVGSISKQFTAASVALLALRGQVSLTDDVRKYIPELPAFGAPVTIDQLIHHTSGVRDFWSLIEVAGQRLDDAYSTADLITLLAKQRQPNFVAGSEFNYANTSYALLGIIVQRITGRTLAQFAAAELFAPLGMRSTTFHDDHARPIRGRASAYAPLPNGEWRESIVNSDIVGHSGLFTTITDLQLWDENFYTGRIGGAPLLEMLQQRGRLNDGTPLAYAFGMELGYYRGLAMVEHAGSDGGYRAEYLRFPTLHTSVTTLCNVATADAVQLARRTADIVIDAKFPEPSPYAAPQTQAAAPPSSVSSAGTVVSTGDLTALAGTYYSSELDVTYTLVVDGSNLVLHRPRAPIQPAQVIDRRTIRATGLVLRFDAAAHPSTFTVDNGRARGMEFTRVR